MNNHKATPQQWTEVETQAGNLKGILTSSTPPPVATDEELQDIWDRALEQLND